MGLPVYPTNGRRSSVQVTSLKTKNLFAIPFYSHLRFIKFIHCHLLLVRLCHHQPISVVLMLLSSTSGMSHMAFMVWFSLLAQKALMLCSSLKGWMVWITSLEITIMMYWCIYSYCIVVFANILNYLLFLFFIVILVFFSNIFNI